MVSVENTTVAISTYGNRLSQALRVASKFNKLGFKTLIVHQAYEMCNRDFIEFDCRVIQLDSVGVTKSRNAAIDAVNTDFIWFMDDDIDIKENDVKKFISTIPEGCDIISSRILNEYGDLRKKYPNPGVVKSKRQVLGVGTIELIANVSFLKSKNIYFPEFMGAGTDFPVGDEAVFVAQVLRNRGRLYHSDYAVVVHPDDSSGKQIDSRTLVSKGLMIRLVFGYLNSILVCLYLSIPLSKLAKKSKLNILRKLLRGVLSKEN